MDTIDSTDASGDEDSIRIGQRDECTVCGGLFPYRVRLRKGNGVAPEVELITAHPHCRLVMTRILQYRQQLLNEEFNLFLLKYNKYGD